MVITAKVMALNPRVFSSNRSFRYSGTERLAAVVKGHHEDADEDHRRDRAYPVEVGRHHAVLGAGAAQSIISSAPMLAARNARL